MKSYSDPHYVDKAMDELQNCDVCGKTRPWFALKETAVGFICEECEKEGTDFNG